MNKLSTHYRQDDSKGVPKSVKIYLDKQFLGNLENINIRNPKLLVVFSGGNGVGKTTIAQKIVRELQGLVLENDRIKSCILTLLPDIGRDDLNVLTWKYSMDLYARLGEVTPNGLIVRDGVIDWYYDRILPVFEDQGYHLFVISFDISKEKRIALIKARGDKQTVSVERLMTIIDDHDVHTKRFRQEYQPDVVLTDATLFDHDKVIAKLRERLSEL